MIKDSDNTPELTQNDYENKIRPGVTMKDVARLAGVSHGTVSNVLNGVKGVSSDKIKRVEAAVKELGYEQNALAKNLKMVKGGNNIYVVFPDIGEPEYEEIYETVSRIAEEMNLRLNLFVCNELPYKEKQILNQATMFNADGILLITCQPKNEKLFKNLMKSGHKIVSMLREVENCGFVGIDVRETLIESINQQISAGARKIAMLTGPREYSFDTACIDAYLNALFSADIAIKNEYLLVTDYDKESAMQQAIKLLNSEDTPEVIYVTSEIFAEGVRKAIALTCIDSARPKLVIMKSRRWTDVTVPNEEYIILPYGKMGEMAFRMLIDTISNEKRAYNKLVKPLKTEEEPLRLRTNLSGGRNVRVLLPNNHAGRAVKYLCNDFKRSTGIDVQADLINYREMLNTIIENRTTKKYDIFSIDVPWIKVLASEGYIEELGGYIKNLEELRSKFPVQIFDEYSLLDEKLWVLPFSFTTQLLFYRKDLFEKLKNKRLYYEWYKEELHVPKTWEEYNKVARLFTKQFNPDSDTLYGTALGGRAPSGATSEYLPRVWAQGINLFNGDACVIDREKAVYALENYVECYNYSHPESYKWWWDDEAMDFCQGNSAMMVQYSDQVTILRDRNISQVVGKTGFDVVPGNASLLGGWSIGMNKYSEIKDEAFEFIKWTISEKMSVVNAVLGRIIPYASVRNSTELLSLYPWHEATFRVFPNAKKRLAPDTADGKCISENIFEKIIGSAVNEAIRKKCTAKEAIQKMSESLDEIYRL